MDAKRQHKSPKTEENYLKSCEALRVVGKKPTDIQRSSKTTIAWCFEGKCVKSDKNGLNGTKATEGKPRKEEERRGESRGERRGESRRRKPRRKPKEKVEEKAEESQGKAFWPDFVVWGASGRFFATKRDIFQIFPASSVSWALLALYEGSN